MTHQRIQQFHDYLEVQEQAEYYLYTQWMLVHNEDELPTLFDSLEGSKRRDFVGVLRAIHEHIFDYDSSLQDMKMKQCMMTLINFMKLSEQTWIADVLATEGWCRDYLTSTLFYISQHEIETFDELIEPGNFRDKFSHGVAVLLKEAFKNHGRELYYVML